ncbi:MAG: hypothetical protein WCZ85_00405 [Bacilli bacterium]
MNCFVRPPIIHRTVSDIHRVFCEEQPIICEHVNRIFNHHIRRNRFIPRQLCCEFNDCCVENIGCCPNMPFAGIQPLFGEPQFADMAEIPGPQVGPQFTGMDGMAGPQPGTPAFDFQQGQFRRSRRL